MPVDTAISLKDNYTEIKRCLIEINIQINIYRKQQVLPSLTIRSSSCLGGSVVLLIIWQPADLSFHECDDDGCWWSTHEATRENNTLVVWKCQDRLLSFLISQIVLQCKDIHLYPYGNLYKKTLNFCCFIHIRAILFHIFLARIFLILALQCIYVLFFYVYNLRFIAVNYTSHSYCYDVSLDKQWY